MKTNTNCSIQAWIKEKAIELGLGLSNCLEFGILFKLAEKDDCLYPRNLLSLKLERVTERLDEALRRIEELEADEADKKIGDEKISLNLGKTTEEVNYPEDSYGN